MDSQTFAVKNNNKVTQVTQKPNMQLVVQKQGCDEKRSIVNGRPVHTVVKNAPFVLQLALNHNSPKPDSVNLSRLQFHTALVYDADEPPYNKEVDFVKVKPVEHKAKVSGQGTQILLEVRLKVLTSQHENSFFRVKITAVLAQNNSEQYSPELVVYSDAIKVMSKPEQIMKKAHQKKKRTVEESLSETVARILDQQKQQERLIQQLIGSVAADDAKRKQLQVQEPPQQVSSPKVKETNFEHCFDRFISAYEVLPQEERPRKIRRVMRNASSTETEQVSSFLDQLSNEHASFSLQNSQTQVSTPHVFSECGLQEFFTLDDVYQDFLTQPLFVDLMI